MPQCSQWKCPECPSDNVDTFTTSTACCDLDPWPPKSNQSVTSSKLATSECSRKCHWDCSSHSGDIVATRCPDKWTDGWTASKHNAFVNIVSWQRHRNFPWLPGLDSCSTIFQVLENATAKFNNYQQHSRMRGNPDKWKTKYSEHQQRPILSLEQGDEESFDRLTGGSSIICFSLWSITQSLSTMLTIHNVDFKLQRSNTTKQNTAI